MYSKERSNFSLSSLKSEAVTISISIAFTSNDLVSFIISSSTSWKPVYSKLDKSISSLTS